jgi:hypothetical protein
MLLFAFKVADFLTRFLFVVVGTTTTGVASNSEELSWSSSLSGWTIGVASASTTTLTLFTLLVFSFPITSFAVVSSGENVNDGHEVFSKLGLLWRFSMIFAVNNEFDPKSSEQEFKEVKGDPTKSVAVGNHNASNISVETTLDKLLKSWPLKVDATANV